MLRLLAIAVLVAGCSPAGSNQTSRQTTDTTVAPVKATDTTVVQKTTDVKVDTVKKTNNKKP